MLVRRFILPTILCCIPLIAAGQTFRGKVSGTITDAQGGAVSGAKITLTEMSSAAAFATESNSEGFYTILYLPPGRYRVRIEARGFQIKLIDNLEIRVGDQLPLDHQLNVGQASESVTVSGNSTPLLESSTATMGQVIDRRVIEDMPLADGNPFTLARLAAGVAFTDISNLRFTRPFDNGGTSSISTNGARGQNNEFTLDGIPNNGAFGRQVSYVPPAEAVQEFKVVTSSFDAQQGHSAGGQIDVALRSGANRPFGSLYWFNRNEALAGNEYFVNANMNCARDENGKCKRNPLRYNRYGATVGGPVVLPWLDPGPKLWNGKDRVFFFFAFEGLKQVTPSSSFVTVPTEAERNGDFSALTPRGITIYDPLTATPLPGGRVQRQPITCNGRVNVICPERFNQIGQNYLSFYPLPNRPGDIYGRNNLFANQPRFDDYHSEAARVDASLSEKQRIFGRYTHGWRRQYVQSFSGVNNGIDATSVHTFRVNNGAAVDHVYTISPTTVLNTRVGFTRFVNTGKWLSEGFDPKDLGFSDQTVALFGGVKYLPPFYISNISRLSGPLQQYTAYDVYTVQPTLTRIVGTHNLKFGYDARVYRINELPQRHEAGFLIYDSTQVVTRQFSDSGAATIGQELAAVLLGYPSSGGIENGVSRSNQLPYHGLFFQDDWKASKRLTLNLGLRWDVEGPTTERYNRNTRGFDFTSASPLETAAIAAYRLAPIPEVPVESFKVKGGLLFADENHRGFYGADKNNFQPRLGFAFQLTPKTVVRGGLAIYSAPFYVDGNSQPGFAQSTTMVPTNDQGLTFVATPENPFPNGLSRPIGAAAGLSASVGNEISFISPDRRNEMARRYELSLQRVLPGRLLLDLAWVRSAAYDIPVNYDLNAVPAKYLSTLNRRDSAVIAYLATTVANPFSGQASALNGPSVARSQLLRPYPQFTSITTQRPDGRSTYNAAQLRVERRFANGYTFNIAYTFSKLIGEYTL
ncbi:MAG TPA: carboxypeptidase regulatory-like domain-containing protein, partial [Blastocatellia bacterium]|nr:carboxypeptidase regulatory-like domain-containing protein [Blastocatellia bacterium]